MTWDAQRVKLPDGEVGSGRCFEIAYGGTHGDLRFATWQGDIEYQPEIMDASVKQFSMAHGSDAYFVAALAGYLKRAGKADEEIAETMVGAAENLLADPPRVHQFDRSPSGLGYYVTGRPLEDADIPSAAWEALIRPVPQAPGSVYEAGGTGMYTHEAQAGQVGLVIARLREWRSSDGRGTEYELLHSAEFTTNDIPAIAKAACTLAQGDYRKEVYLLINKLYVEKVSPEKV